MAFAAPLMMIGGGILKGLGEKQQYDAASAVSTYNQSVANQNADLIERAAANNKAASQRKKMARLSTMKAQYGFRGVDLSGSPLLAMAESASELELDIQNEEFNSLVDATKQRSQASVYGMEAQEYKKAGKRALVNAAFSTGSNFAATY